MTPTDHAKIAEKILGWKYLLHEKYWLTTNDYPTGVCHKVPNFDDPSTMGMLVEGLLRQRVEVLFLFGSNENEFVVEFAHDRECFFTADTPHTALIAAIKQMIEEG